MYLIIHGSTERLKRLLRSWTNPGPKHRKLREGQIVAKLGPGTLLMKFDRDTIHLLAFQKDLHPSEVTLYVAQDVSQDRLWDLFSSLKKIS